MSEPLMCTPLAMVRPEEVGDFEALPYLEMPEEISLWAKRRVKGFGKFLGVTCSGFEDWILHLLMDIEKNKRSAEANNSRKGKNSRQKGKRELKQLCCSLNFSQLGSLEGEKRRSGSVF